MTKIFELPALKFAFDALEPAIDARTMEIHQAHHAPMSPTSQALESAPGVLRNTITDISATFRRPEAIRPPATVGAMPATLFWDILQPGESNCPRSLAMIDQPLVYDALLRNSTKQPSHALARWAWLALDAQKSCTSIQPPIKTALWMVKPHP